MDTKEQPMDKLSRDRVSSIVFSSNDKQPRTPPTGKKEQQPGAQGSSESHELPQIMKPKLPLLVTESSLTKSTPPVDSISRQNSCKYLLPPHNENAQPCPAVLQIVSPNGVKSPPISQRRAIFGDYWRINNDEIQMPSSAMNKATTMSAQSNPPPSERLENNGNVEKSLEHKAFAQHDRSDPTMKSTGSLSPPTEVALECNAIEQKHLALHSVSTPSFSFAQSDQSCHATSTEKSIRSILRTSSKRRLEEKQNKRVTACFDGDTSESAPVPEPITPRSHIPTVPKANTVPRSEKSQISAQLVVRFDPCISVTEYPENSRDRKWFTAEELDEFKKEAIESVKKFSTCYPSAAQARMDGRIDPITSSRKQRALYTNPGLCATDEDIVIGDGSLELRGLLASEIRNILVVNRHSIILSLFQRSLQKMIPHATITTATSGKEAIKLVKSSIIAGSSKSCQGKDGEGETTAQSKSFDIIIVEERLCSRMDLQRHGTNEIHASSYISSDLEGSSYQSAGENQEQTVDLMSGSELLRHIVRLEEACFGPYVRDSHISNNTSEVLPVQNILSDPGQRRSLLIGVISSIGEDCEKLIKGGAE
eukprot:scaffold55228_cov62-Attheya_sp.AAC.6